jgi:hypothetical protein
MNYKSFINNLSSVRGVEGSTLLCYGHVVEQSNTGTIIIDKQDTEFSSLEEAKEYIKCLQLTHVIQNQLVEDISEKRVAGLIKEHHSDVKITDKLIEAYVDAASSKIFTLDPVVISIKEYVEVKQPRFSKMEFVLEDGSLIAIDRTTFDIINNKLGQHSDVIEYMRESTSNFLEVVNLLEE